MSFEQIRQIIFANVARTIALRRLSNLCQYGFIRKIGASLMSRRLITAYSLTQSGLANIHEKYSTEITKELVDSDSVVHDLKLVNIRKRIESLSCVEKYYTENMLQACDAYKSDEKLGAFTSINSDVALRLKKNDISTFVSLEFENSHKMGTRYAEKLKAYYLEPRIPGILYVCENSSIRKIIEKEDTALSAEFSPKIYYALSADVLEPNKKCTFTSISGNKFLLA